MNDAKLHANINEDQRANILLSLVPGIGPRIFAELIETFGCARNVISASVSELREVTGVGVKLSGEIVQARQSGAEDALIEACREHAIQIIDQTHADYPAALRQIYDPPLLLFAKGKLVPADSISLAIVGARHATNYGVKIAEQLGRGLAMAGFTVVSGLARGIDAAAHRGALQSGGRTIGVLGSGLQNVYPPEHADLAQEVIGQGALLSEEHPFQPPQSGAFPKRNRIVTGMSLGVIVVEAADRSGALISARLAGEQNREVFAVPGRIDNRMSRGCHALIRDGATLVRGIDDVLEQLGPLAQPASVSNDKTIRHPAELKLTEQESKILNCIDVEPTSIDVVIEQTDLPPARVLSTISVLEIRRLIRRVSGNRVARI